MNVVFSFDGANKLNLGDSYLRYFKLRDIPPETVFRCVDWENWTDYIDLDVSSFPLAAAKSAVFHAHRCAFIPIIINTSLEDWL